MFGKLNEKSIALIRSMLKEGMSLKKMTLCIAVGITLGIFPVLGMTTLLCALAAFALRLNMPAIQLVNYMVYPMQLVLLAPFYGAGSWLFSQERRLTAAKDLVSLLSYDFWGSMANLWDLTLYAIFTWMAICPFLILMLYLTLKPVVGAVASIRKQHQAD
ncbi:MAG: DUF2062 domain-containing protein [Deltaproteobacteria bacterium]|nr:DUF2062 domain-containing protein [Deltaproteobacteria bacterium]